MTTYRKGEIFRNLLYAHKHLRDLVEYHFSIYQLSYSRKKNGGGVFHLVIIFCNSSFNF